MIKKLVPYVVFLHFDLKFLSCFIQLGDDFSFLFYKPSIYIQNLITANIHLSSRSLNIRNVFFDNKGLLSFMAYPFNFNYLN